MFTFAAIVEEYYKLESLDNLMKIFTASHAQSSMAAMDAPRIPSSAYQLVAMRIYLFIFLATHVSSAAGVWIFQRLNWPRFIAFLYSIRMYVLLIIFLFHRYDKNVYLVAVLVFAFSARGYLLRELFLPGYHVSRMLDISASVLGSVGALVMREIYVAEYPVPMVDESDSSLHSIAKRGLGFGLAKGGVGAASSGRVPRTFGIIIAVIALALCIAYLTWMDVEAAIRRRRGESFDVEVGEEEHTGLYNGPLCGPNTSKVSERFLASNEVDPEIHASFHWFWYPLKYVLFYVSLETNFGLALVYGSFDVAKIRPTDSINYAVGLMKPASDNPASFVQAVPFQALFYVISLFIAVLLYYFGVTKTKTRYEWFMSLSFAVAVCSNAAMCYFAMLHTPQFFTMNFIAFCVAATNEFGRSLFLYPYNYRSTTDKSVSAIIISIFATLVFVPFFALPNLFGVSVLYASLVGATILVTVGTMCVA